MTDREKARRACHWLKTYVLGGKASIGEEANGIRRSYSVEDTVLDEIRCLCDQFARLDTQPRPEPIASETWTGTAPGIPGEKPDLVIGVKPEGPKNPKKARRK